MNQPSAVAGVDAFGDEEPTVAAIAVGLEQFGRPGSVSGASRRPG